MTPMRNNSLFRPIPFALVIQWTLLLSGCGGGSSSPPPPPPTITSVTVLPNTANLFVKAPQQFTATVQGTGSFNPGVIWLVNGVAGGNSTVGTIGNSGLYTAPAAVPSPSSINVTARSVQDSSKLGTSTVTINPENVQISISPNTGASVQLNESLQFSATVTGTANTSVFWTVNNSSGGQSYLGFIDGDGKYTAPSNLPGSKQVTISAISQEDNSKSASTLVTILATAGGITVSISPQGPSVNFDGSQNIQFTATVSGTTNIDVTWSLDNLSYPNIGQISSTGLFTPVGLNCTNVPPTGAVRAVSVANPGAQAVSLINLVPPAPVITTVSPQPADAESIVQISGTFAPGASFKSQYPGPNGTTIPGAITTASSTAISGPVPLGASSGSISLQQTCASSSYGFQYPSQGSNSLPFQRLPRLRIRANTQVLTPGESTQMLSAFMGDPTARPITWSAKFGTVSSSGVFTAASGNNWDKVTGCIASTQQCDFFVFSVVPTRVAPAVPVVPLNGSIQLSEVQGGSTLSPTWSIAGGGGTLNSGGLYSAASTLQDAGATTVSANTTGGTATNAVGVVGGFPGMVNRLIDYPDISTNASTTTTLPKTVTVDGNRVYVFSDNLPFGLTNGHYKWIDAYDATDPAHPAWTSAVEGFDEDLDISPMQSFASGGYLWRVTAAESASPAGSLTTQVAFLDSSSGKPILKQFFSVPKLWTYSFYKGLFIGIPNSFAANGNLWQQVTAQVFDGRSGTVFPSQISLANPNPATPLSILAIFNTDTRVFLLYQQQQGNSFGPFQLSTYDLTTNPPALLQTIQAQTGSIFLPGIDVPGVFGKYLFAGGGIYDISSGLPVLLAPLQGGQPTDMNGSLGLVGVEAISLVDFSNPASPKTLGSLYNGDDLLNGYPRFVGNHVYRPAGGLEVFDVSAPAGGQLPEANIQGSGTFGLVNSLLVNSTDLYAAENTDIGTFVTTFDLSKSPPQKINSYPLNAANNEIPFAFAASGHYLFVGSSTELLVLDVSNPSSPVRVTSLALSISCLALIGNTLYAGTFDSHLVAINVTNPAAPVAGTSIGIAGFPVTMHANGSLLLIAADTAGLLTYSIANPSTPALLSQFQPSSAVEDVAVDSHFALLAAADGGFVVADITNVASPVVAGQVPLSVLSCYADLSPADGLPGLISISVSGGIAYLGSANMFGRVFGFDYRNVAHPRVVSMAAYGNAIIESIFTMTSSGSNFFAAGDLFGDVVYETDATQPRNFIRQMCMPAPFAANASTTFPEMRSNASGTSAWNPKTHVKKDSTRLKN